MAMWYQVRRILAGLIAFGTAYILENRGMPFWGAGLVGIAAAIVIASLLFPLLWKPPKEEAPPTKKK